MKKINAVISWLLTLSLLGHLGSMSYSMLTGWYDYNICKSMAYATAALAATHVALSLIIVFFGNDNTNIGYYKKWNIRVILQRASALIIVALLHLHVKAFAFIVAGTALSVSQKFEILITEILFFGAIFTHLAVSISRSLITMGLLREEKTEKNVDKAIYIICLALMLITTTALTTFVLKWTGFAG